MSDYWDERIGDGATHWYHREMAKRVITQLDSRQGSLVCDVGCGLGQTARLVAPFAGTVQAIDQSATRIEKADRMDAPYLIDFHRGYAEALPLANESTRVVYALQVMQHFSIETQVLFAIDALRALKPGGAWLWQAVEVYDGYEPKDRHVAHTENHCRELCSGYESVTIDRQQVPDSPHTWLWVTAVKA